MAVEIGELYPLKMVMFPCSIAFCIQKLFQPKCNEDLLEPLTSSRCHVAWPSAERELPGVYMSLKAVYSEYINSVVVNSLEIL